MLNSGGWNDTNTNARSWAIIEYSTDCNGDGVVDFAQCREGLLLDNNANNVPDCCEQGQPCVLIYDADIDQTGTVDAVGTQRGPKTQRVRSDIGHLMTASAHGSNTG